ncbi:MAG: dethiobiotin synthase [Alphaproteobacteria bacterium]|jgi:dethiobiotin synthetase|nr:dethiobiotin synthase [Alphaproteobacteria bacterium]
MQKYFITSTGTEIGKTYFICSLIKKLIAEKNTVKAIKPIITGLDFSELTNSDSAQILNSLGQKITKENILNISPFYYNVADSPDSAALIQAKNYLNYNKILDFCSSFLNNHNKDYALIEGIGGIMVPINQHKTILNLIKDLNIEIILVIGNYLGSRSHSLNVIELCQLHNIKIHKIMLNNFPNDLTNAQNIQKSLTNFCANQIDIFN